MLTVLLLAVLLASGAWLTGHAATAAMAASVAFGVACLLAVLLAASVVLAALQRS